MGRFLPPKLHVEILKFYVQIAELRDVFRARQVSRHFAKAIDHNLLARTPIQTFIDNECHDNCIISIREAPQPIDFIDKYLEAHLLYHVRELCGANREFPQLINHIVDILLRFRPAESNRLLKRSGYQQDLVQAFVITSRGRIEFFLKANLAHYNFSSARTVRMYGDWRYLVTHRLDPSKLLAMAAAVGNMSAVNSYLANGGDIFASWPTFPSPLCAAASTGQTEVLQFFLSGARSVLINTNCGHFTCLSFDGVGCKWIFSLLHSAAEYSIEARQPATAVLLLDLLSTSPMREDVYYPTFIRLAAETGCTNTFRAVLSKCPSTPNSLQRQHHIITGFEIACRRGHTNLVRFFLQDYGAPVTTISLPSLDVPGENIDTAVPLYLVVQGSHRGVAKLLIDHGAEIKNLCLLPTAILDTTPETSFPITKFLLDRGAIVDLDAADAAEEIAVNIQYSGQVSQDRIKTVLLMCKAIMDNLHVTQLRKWDGLARVATNVYFCTQAEYEHFHVLEGAIDFVEIAKNFYGWLTPVDRRRRVRKRLGFSLQ